MVDTTQDMGEVDTVPISARPALRAEVLAPRLGRYRIERELGRGGMGVVLAARDPQLGRSVAVKLVTPSEARPVAGQRTRLRLFTEARALARLDHPNVVKVFDVGRHGDAVWIAMELVDGITLRHWAQRGHGWRARLAALVAAGRGLAAAHRDGLVHRDVKPDNVLVGKDGRVCVADFGLARGPETTTELESPIEGVPIRTPRSVALTRPGTVMGTPEYMAPEQKRGASLDIRTDQYSFCVMAHEVLLGTRPGEEGNRYRDADEVPRWVLRVFRRGMRADPRRRFQSMDALLSRLEPRRRRTAVSVLAGLALLGLSTLSTEGRAHDDSTLDAAMPGVVVQAEPYARRLANVGTLLVEGQFEAGLVEARRIEARTAELDDPGLAIEAKLAVGRAALLSRRTPLAAEALEAAYLLADAEGLTSLSAAAAINVAQVHGTLGIDTDLARTWLRRAETAMGDDDTHRVRWLEASGAVELRAGRIEQAEAMYERALDRCGEDSLDTVVALTGLAAVYGIQDEQALAARTWRRAERLQIDLGAPDHPRLATLAANLGVALTRLERHGDALAAFSRARAQAERVPSASRSLPHALNGMAAALNGLGRHEEAVAIADEAVARMRAHVGDHPWVANCLANAGEARWKLGDLEGAERDYSAAHVVWQTTLGSDSATIAHAEVGLGRIAVARGDAAAGVRRLERALELVGGEAGDRVRIAELRLELAQALHANGQRDEARAQAELALAATATDGDRRGRLRGEIEQWLGLVR